jgi:hypothetical protein
MIEYLSEAILEFSCLALQKQLEILRKKAMRAPSPQKKTHSEIPKNRNSLKIYRKLLNCSLKINWPSAC